MTKLQQRKFLRDLSRSVTKSLLASAGRWPAEWDGHELRALLAEQFVREQGTVKVAMLGPGRTYATHTCDRKRSDAFVFACANRRIP